MKKTSLAKYIAITVVAIVANIPMVAQNYAKFSPWLRNQVKEQIATNAKAVRQEGDTTTTTQYANSQSARMLAYACGDDDVLSPYAVAQAGDIYIISATAEEMATLSLQGGVRRLEASPRNDKLCLANSVPAINGDKAWQGYGNLPQAFDGTGVVVGLADIGHDYTHPTFRSTKDGRMRIVRAFDWLNVKESDYVDGVLTAPFGTLYADTTAVLAAQHSTDATAQFHGTHTAGAAAGSGWSSAQSGVAREADIYLVSTLFSSNSDMWPEGASSVTLTSPILGLDAARIYAYADSVGKPAVVSYSAGSTQGLVETDSLYDAFIENLTGPGHIFVASAGNNGTYTNTLLRLNAGDSRVGGYITSNSGIDPFVSVRATGRLKLKFYDISNTNQHITIPLDMTLTGKGYVSASGQLMWGYYTAFVDPRVIDQFEIVVYPGNEGFGSESICYDITLYDDEGSRFLNKEFVITLEPYSDADSTATAELYVQNGQITACRRMSLEGGEEGGTMLSPGSLPSVIGVGATVVNEQYMSLADGQYHNYSTSETAGYRATYSSTGPSVHNLTKPDVMAPGHLIASALNSFTSASALTNYTPYISDTTSYAGQQYQFMAQNGTSMSTPIVAGAIALWLQANPNLTKDDVMDVIAHTSRQPVDTLDYPNYYYGYGEIDVYAGLLYILGLDGIESISSEHVSRCKVLPSANGVTLSWATPCDTNTRVRLYDVRGMLLGTHTVPAGTTTCELPCQATGVVCVQVDGDGSTLVRR